MRFLKVFTVLFLGAMLASCCACKKYQKKYGKPLVGTEWVLSQYEGRTFTSNDNYFFVLDKDGRVSGKGDCNRIMGNYKDYEGQLAIEIVGSTKAFCQNQQMEDQFIKMLQSIDSYKLDGPNLLLTSNGELKAIFEAAPSPQPEKK